MRIELQKPYSLDWDKGYTRKCKKDGRVRLDLFNSNSDRSTTSYARYLVSVKIGRYLTSEEEVDHTDNDCSNDEITNLQVLTIEEHKAKTKASCEGRPTTELKCANCGCLFHREVSKLKISTNTFCSRSCNGLFNYSSSSVSRLIEISESVHNQIVSLRETGLSDYKIAVITGLDRSKIFRYRNTNNIK